MVQDFDLYVPTIVVPLLGLLQLSPCYVAIFCQVIVMKQEFIIGVFFLFIGCFALLGAGRRARIG